MHLLAQQEDIALVVISWVLSVLSELTITRLDNLLHLHV